MKIESFDHESIWRWFSANWMDHIHVALSIDFTRVRYIFKKKNQLTSSNSPAVCSSILYVFARAYSHQPTNVCYGRVITENISYCMESRLVRLFWKEERRLLDTAVRNVFKGNTSLKTRKTTHTHRLHNTKRSANVSQIKWIAIRSSSRWICIRN